MFKNSEMILQAILNEPYKQDAYRAYADALIEEGEEERGELINRNLGKYSKFKRPMDGLGEQQPFHCVLPDDTMFFYQFVTKNCFIVDLHITLVDFCRNLEFFFKRQPIQSVYISDCSPRLYGSDVYLEEVEELIYNDLYRWLLPKELTAYFPLEHKMKNYAPEAGIQSGRELYRQAYRFKDTEEAAQAVSVACVKWGRAKTGLLPLPENAYGKIRDYRVWY